MNRYGATLAAIGLLLALGACGGSDKPAAASNRTPIIPSTPVTVPTETPRATPTPVDPTTAARQQVLAAYAVFYTQVINGLRDGGVTYPYEKFMIDPALTAAKDNQTYYKGLRRAKISGDGRLLESKVSDIRVSSKSSTATVVACVTDNLTAVDKNGKVIAKPAGKISRRDGLKLVKGRWMVYLTETQDKSYGCTR
ncbi:hypothetical protein [Kribbella solani]|uniref:Nuclear transport factor 2 family protein n=1 Tax=Kribbella solani TaxID=236067 RepID=A0A841DW09_9ACTN|nr:hypothetical protein [Kribbella solani]